MIVPASSFYIFTPLFISMVLGQYSTCNIKTASAIISMRVLYSFVTQARLKYILSPSLPWARSGAQSPIQASQVSRIQIRHTSICRGTYHQQSWKMPVACKFPTSSHLVRLLYYRRCEVEYRQ